MRLLSLISALVKCDLLNRKSWRILNNATYRDETKRLWASDVKMFSTGQCQGFDFNKATDRKKLYLKVFKNWSERIGFYYDKELSSTRKPVFSKNFIDPWKLCFEIDTVYFYRLIEDERVSYEQGRPLVVKSGPQFYMSFGLLHNRLKGTSKIKFDEHLLFGLDSFYPIQLFFIDPLMYVSFYTLEELEAIINIHVTMYELLQTDFENSLRKGFSSSRPFDG